MSIVVVADERMVEHRPPTGHPERPERFVAATRALRDAPFADGLTWRVPTEAPAEAVARVHDKALLHQLDELGALERARVDPDTHMSAGSLRAARLAAGAGLEAISVLDDGDSTAAFCLVRPPGHHATPTRSMGFCLYNNVAVAAQALTDRGERVAIVDIDAHHGNGTQDAFYDRGDVLFVSLHEYPQYPGTGALDERGAGAGLGTTINVPLPSGTTGDVYLRAVDEVIAPAIESFRPTWLLVSAGFDAHRADPLTSLGLTAADYHLLGRRLAATVAPGRLIAFLEGGYDLDALAHSTSSFTAALLGERVDLPAHERETAGGPGDRVVDRLIDLDRADH